MEQLKGTLKTVITGLLALLLVLVLANLILWNVYKMNICDQIYTDCTTAGFSYDEASKVYSGKSGKLVVKVNEPSLLKFDMAVQVEEQPANVYNVGKTGEQPLFVYAVTADFKSDFTYTIYVNGISSVSGATKSDLGSFTIDPSSLTIVEDNTVNGDAETLLSTYNTRINKLVETANTIFSIDIQ